MRRKEDDERRKQQTIAKRRKRIREILVALGLWDRLEATDLRERLLQCHYPRVEVALAEAMPRSVETAGLLRELEQIIKRATFTCPSLGDSPLVIDYFSFVMPIMDVLSAATSKDANLNAFLISAKEKTKGLASPETTAAACCEAIRHLEEALIKVGRIDRHLYRLEVEHGRKSNGKYFVKLVTHQVNAQQRTVKTPDGPRPAFRCGQPFGLRGIDWVEWPADALGYRNDQSRYSVYVQSHALNNLYRTEARALFIEDGEWLVHDYLWQSLREPKAIPIDGRPGEFLVEYRLNCHKLGYLPVQLIDGVALVKSFLFLTMDGTPEGDALRKHPKLRLRRDDKLWLKLDQIETFLFTDVQFDQEIVDALSECGCGHLFTILKEPPRDRFIPGYAKEVRSYLQF